MDVLLEAVPLTIIGVASVLILGILFGVFLQVFQLVKDFVLYMFLIPLGMIWAANTLDPGLVEFTYWNCVALGTLNFAVMLVISAGVNVGINAALPDPREILQAQKPPPEAVENLKERMRKAAEDEGEGN